MPQKVYVVIRNTLLFFLLVNLIDGVVLYGAPVVTKILWGLVFGVLMVMVPFLLQFFKISVSAASKILLSLVLSFVFYFMIYNGVGGIGTIRGSLIDLGLGTNVIRLDALSTLIVAALVSALASVGLDALSRLK